ncbi:MAG TPA: hypothetical protein PKO35_01475, partial [Candidatus Atribacteria bacterium]|nr:hypothetical protein [Candidatus Atribacteria bacterium]
MADEVSIQFTKIGHYWLDSGLVGLIKTLDGISVKGVNIEKDENSLTLRGEPDSIKNALETAYDELVKQYYSVSTKKQKEDTSTYNFYYDEKEDKFVAFPKMKPMGIADLIFNKAGQPAGESLAWEGKYSKEVVVDGKIIKRTYPILPKQYRHLQNRLEEFLCRHGLSETNKFLINGPYRVKPKLDISVVNKKIKGTCCLCGEKSGKLKEANQTVFPLITGTSGVLSFNPGAGKPEKVCWKCSLLGKFVPVTGFYMYQGDKLDNLFIFLPYSVSLEKMELLYDELQNLKDESDPNLLYNFKPNLGYYIQHPYEVTLAFLHCLYDRLLTHKRDQEDDGILDLDAMLNITFNKSPVEFYVIHTRKEGDTYSGKLFWPFKDSVYVFRLMNYLRQTTGYSLKTIMEQLIDYSKDKNEAKTFMRNKLIERMLKKQSILDLVEKFVFHTKNKSFDPLFRTLVSYEILLREGDKVYKEEQDAAVKLGRCIGMAVGSSKDGKKGDLYALRKSRRKSDFLEQINRLQFKLGSELTVPSDLYEGKLTDDNFFEF